MAGPASHPPPPEMCAAECAFSTGTWLPLPHVRDGGCGRLHIRSELLTANHAEDEIGEAVPGRLGVVDDLPDHRHVEVLDASTQRVSHQLLGGHADELRRIAQRDRAYALHTDHL